MKFYKIDIDEDIYRYLKSKAEPFVDTPNTVLRRELLHDSDFTINKDASEAFPDLPGGIPSALQQTLEVIHLVQNRAMTRTEATNAVADRHGVAPQTVTDKYCRQLNKKAYEIDRLLEEKNMEGMKRLLLQKFDRHVTVIEKILSDKQH